MSIEINLIILIIFAFILANMTFMFNQRIFFVLKPKQSPTKSPFWHIPEFFTLYGIIGSLAYFLEQSMGDIHGQNWEFYVITFCLFVVFGFPGFVYRYLWKKTKSKS